MTRAKYTPWAPSKKNEGGFKRDRHRRIFQKKSRGEDSRSEVERIREATAAISSRRCPNDGESLRDGHCKACRFHLTIATPLVISPRAAFNRKWYPKASQNRKTGRE